MASYEPDKLTFHVWKGTTFHKRWLLHQGDISTGPQDISGWTAVWHVYNQPKGTLLLTLTSSPPSGIILLGGTGIIDVKMTVSQVNALPADQAFYDLMVTDSAGDTSVLLEGALAMRGIEP